MDKDTVETGVDWDRYAGAGANAPTVETVLSVRHYTDRLFAFRTTRPPSLRFRSGEFVMIGLPINGKALLRAYSIASPAWDEGLEFYSIKAPNGPLTTHLQRIVPGDRILLGRKPTGTLVLDALTPAKRLYMFATGTGLAPFASLVRDPECYQKFAEVILVHTCRLDAELTYGREVVADAQRDPLVGDFAATQLRHIAATTRESGPITARITTLIDEGRLFELLGVPPLSPAEDRAMLCGSMDMIRDVKARMEKAQLREGAVSEPGDFVIERAFVG
jgi:ferredoxin--NADP+ reductase